MRLKDIQFAYDVSPVSRGGLTLVRPRTIDVDSDGRFYITEYPDLVRTTTYYSPGRNDTSIVTYHPESCRRADLPVPHIDDFQADMLKILKDGKLLLVQFGQWKEGKINGLISTVGGEIIHKLQFGECIADFSVDEDGNIFVIYNEEGYFGALRKGQPLIELFSPSGGKIEDSEVLARVLDFLHNENIYDGNKIDCLTDGGLLVNGQYCFNNIGELTFAWSHKSQGNITIVDEYDNILFIPPVKGGLFQLHKARGGYAETAISICRPVDYSEYGWFHCIKDHKLYLLNRTIPKVEVYQLIYQKEDVLTQGETSFTW